MTHSVILHLVSDTSGETVSSMARAAITQYDVVVEQRLWWLIRSVGQAERVLNGVKAEPGPVLHTVIDPQLRTYLETGFRNIGVAHLGALDRTFQMLTSVLNVDIRRVTGRRHMMDRAYFQRIDAMQYAIDHDDGQSQSGLERADVIVFGVSRTSKTPTSMSLANRGLMVANVPIVPGGPHPEHALRLKGPLKVGLTCDTERLLDIRRHRLRLMNDRPTSTYIDEALVREEVTMARRLYARFGLSVINVTRKSIEEVAATILELHAQQTGNRDRLC